MDEAHAKKKTKWDNEVIVKTIVLAASSIFLFILCSSEPEYNVPDLRLYDLDSNLVSLHTLLDDGPVFICVWALWCPPAIEELDALNLYYEELVSYHIHMLGIHVGADSIDGVDSITTQHDWKHIILLDPEVKVNDLYEINSIPVSMAIDQQGDIIFDYVGYGTGYDTMFVDTLRVLFGQ